jgi:hypothetical protein
MHHINHIVEALARRTQNVFDTAQGAKRHQHLTQRLERLYGALELARLLGSAQLRHRIETLVDTTRRDIENDC